MKSPTGTSDEMDDYPKVTRADLDRAMFGVNRKPTPRKRRVTMLLDTGLVGHSLDALLAQVTDGNRHSETPTGAAVGGEAW